MIAAAQLPGITHSGGRWLTRCCVILCTVYVLTEDELRERLEPDRVITAIESAFRDRYTSIVISARSHMNLAGGVFLIMACYDGAGHALGIKLVVVQDRPQQTDRVHATYMLLEPQTGAPKLIMPANYLTDLRTAATSALATRLLSREDVRILGVFGIGRLARAHLRVLPLVRRFERILVCGRDSGETREFTQSMSSETDLPIEAVDPQLCAESDVVCTCTTSQTPLFDGNVLRAGTHLNLVGAFQPHSREVDSNSVRRARVFVETYDSALAEAGDLVIPLQEGVIDRNHIAGDLHELVSGQTLGRIDPETVTIFKSVGCALEDLATSELLST